MLTLPSLPFAVPPLAATTSPLPAPSVARGAAPQSENSFSRQLERLRDNAAQPTARAPAPKPPTPSSSPPPHKPQAAPHKEVAHGPAPSRPNANAKTAPHSETSDAPDSAAAAKKAAEGDDKTSADGTAAGTPPTPLTPAPDAQAPPADATAAAVGTDSAGAATPADLAASTDAAAAAAATLAALHNPPTADGAAPVPQTDAGATPSLQANAQRDAQRADVAASRDVRDANQAATTDPKADTWQQAQAAALLKENMGSADPTRATESRAADAAAALQAPLPGAALLGPGGSITHTGKAGEVAAANLATPVTSAEFRSALGLQVSVLARSGVQQAELHLNPAELGPVSIQIVLDGQQAQVNFGADSALTRQIIESGMPELASALRDAGLTLTGGGVSQHAGGQQQQPEPNPASGGRPGNAHSGTALDGATDPHPEQTRRSSARRAVGGVDLYA